MKGITLPRKSHRRYSRAGQYFKLPSDPQDSVIWRSGKECAAKTLTEVKKLHMDGYAVKMGSIKIDSQFGPLSIPLYQPMDFSGSTSNISSRMSPPVPTVKSLLKTGARRHKVKSYRQTKNSPYVRLVQSDLSVIGTHTH